MPVKKFDEKKEYWMLMNCESGEPNFFTTKKAAQRFAKKHKLNNFIIGREDKK